MELLEKESEDSEAKTEKINQGGEPFALKPRLQHSEDHHAANGDPDEQSDDSVSAHSGPELGGPSPVESRLGTFPEKKAP